MCTVLTLLPRLCTKCRATGLHCCSSLTYQFLFLHFSAFINTILRKLQSICTSFPTHQMFMRMNFWCVVKDHSLVPDGWYVQNFVHGTYRTLCTGRTELCARDVQNFVHGTYRTLCTVRTELCARDVQKSVHGTYRTLCTVRTELCARDVQNFVYGTYNIKITLTVFFNLVWKM